MRASWIWIVLVIAIAAVGWMVFGNPSGQGGGGEYGSELPDDPGEGGAMRGAGGNAGLKGSGGKDAGQPRVPSDIRGRGMIQGVARRGGNPVAAVVELRHVQEIDPSDPFKGGLETQFIARLLDAGISGTSVIARTETGADGVFKFRGLATGLYEIRAAASDGAVGLGSATLPAKGARVEATVDIPEGDQSLSGVVTYADGKPFQGLVLASKGNAFAMMMGAGSKAMPTQTDAEGRFKLVGLTPGRYQISALIPGVMRVMGAPIDLPYAGDYLMKLNAAGVEVKGKVIDAETEAAIAGATIFGGGGDPESSFMISTTKSDAEGAFSMVLPGGRGGGMFVRADGYAGSTVDFNSGGPGEALTVSLLRLAKLGGRVTAKEGGAAIAGITVFAMGGRNRGMMPTPVTAVTDAEGRYLIEGVDPGPVQVWAIGGGFASVGMADAGMGMASSPYNAELEPGQEGKLDLEAVPSGRVKGRVLTEAGQAVPGAVVQAISGGQGNPGMAMAFMGSGNSWGSAVADADGAFEIDVLVPGSEYKVSAKAPDHPAATSDKFLAVGGKAESIEIRMKAPRWLDVEVVDSKSGKPISGAGIMAVPSEGSREMMMEVLGGGAMWSTDAEGHARIGPLPGGELRMNVDATGYIAEGGERVAADAKGPIKIELQRGLVIAGTLKLPEGVPAQGVRITVSRSDANIGWFHARPPVQPDGSWRCDTIKEEGEYEISVRGKWQGRGLKGKVLADTGDESVELPVTLEAEDESETLTVSVIDADGKPVPAGRVQLWRFHGQNNTSTSRTRLSTGKATFRGFNTDGELWVEVFELVGSKRGSTIQGPVTFSDGKLEVRLGPGRIIAGSVTEDGGKPVAGVKVTAQAVHPRGKTNRSGREHGSAVSDTDGRFEVKGLGDLEYELHFKVPSDYAPVAGQTTRAGSSGVKVVVTMGMRATLTVLDPDGKPVSGVYVWKNKIQENSSGRSYGPSFDVNNSVTGSDGTVTLRGLEADALYNLTANAPEGRKDLKSIQLKKWSPKDETLRFKRAFTITGTVVDQDGKPASGISVQQRKVGSENWQGWHRTNKKGEFTINQIEAGSYELRARPQNGMVTAMPAMPGAPAPEDPSIVKVRAGAKGVKLTVDLGKRLVVTIRGGKASGSRHRTARLSAPGQGGMLNGAWEGSTKVAFQGLKEGVKYQLWIGGLDDGKYAQADGVEIGSGSLSVQAESGGVVEGTLKIPAGVTFRNLTVGVSSPNGQSHGAPADPKTGRFRIEGLPHDVTYTLHAHGWVSGGDVYQATGTATTGADVTLELKLRKAR